MEGGFLEVFGMLEVERRSFRVGRFKVFEGVVEYDGSCLEDCVCIVFCGLEEIGFRYSVFISVNWFFVFFTVDKKFYK